MEPSNKYAAVQAGLAVYGLGDTPDVAYEEAQYWIDADACGVAMPTVSDIPAYLRAKDRAQLIIVRCSETFYAEASINPVLKQYFDGTELVTEAEYDRQ